MNGLFPLVWGSQEAYLLTAIVLGFLFGFSLERAGFGNARKLAAQFYLTDMTVFKVMFTAILVAMAGFYALAGMGVVDLARMWINPTFLWAEVIGGFLLGAGFIISGLCPGTSVVSLASGRWDGLVTFAGIVIGTALFAVTVAWFPWLERLYESGGSVTTLQALFHLPTWLVVLAVIAMALGAFVGAERVERLFAPRAEPVDHAPRVTPRTPRVKWAVGGALAAVVAVSLAFRIAPPVSRSAPMAAVEPQALAEAIVARDARLLVLDLRTRRDSTMVPGSYAVSDSAALAVLAAAPAGARVVVVDEGGTRRATAPGWPENLSYGYLRGGMAAWRAEVLTPPAVSGSDLASRADAARRSALAAYFSGSGASAPPPPTPTGAAAGGGGKKRQGGC